MILNDELRSLLYPLGFIATFAFAIRFTIQWLVSEYKKESTVPRFFWYISLIGNCTLMLHGWIQLQYHVTLIQGCSAVISWRNLDLMNENSRQIRKRTVFAIIGVIFALITAIFALQHIFIEDSGAQWFRIPTPPWREETISVPFFWHLIGFTGMILFASRFWLQWWFSEQHQKSYLGPSFWWMSLSGGLMVTLYFALLQDLVNLIGPALGLIPYVRNLVLLRKKPKTT